MRATVVSATAFKKNYFPYFSFIMLTVDPKNKIHLQKKFRSQRQDVNFATSRKKVGLLQGIRNITKLINPLSKLCKSRSRYFSPLRQKKRKKQKRYLNHIDHICNGEIYMGQANKTANRMKHSLLCMFHYHTHMIQEAAEKKGTHKYFK